MSLEYLAGYLIGIGIFGYVGWTILNWAMESTGRGIRRIRGGSP